MPKECHLVIGQGAVAGRITSVTHSRTLNKAIGLAMLSPALARSGGEIDIRGERGEITQGAHRADAVLRSEEFPAAAGSRGMSDQFGNVLEFEKRSGCERFGLKGPRAAEWLAGARHRLPRGAESAGSPARMPG